MYVYNIQVLIGQRPKKFARAVIDLLEDNFDDLDEDKQQVIVDFLLKAVEKSKQK